MLFLGQKSNLLMQDWSPACTSLVTTMGHMTFIFISYPKTSLVTYQNFQKLCFLWL